MTTNSLVVWNLIRLGLVAAVGLLELDRLWYITVGKTHPRVFLFWGCVSGW